MIRSSLFVSSAMILVFFADPASAQSSTETYTYDPLGRLVTVETTGGNNNDDTRSICYDDAGNRTEFTSKSDGTVSTCSGGGGGTPPPPPPPPTNNPPVTTNDSISGACFNDLTINVTVNDTDPESNYPLALTAISGGSGGSAGATIYSASTIWVSFGPNGDTTTFTYTVADSLGATSTGQLTVSTSSCGGGSQL